MVWCAAVGCSNYKKKNRDLKKFNFPRDKEFADAWKAKIKRKDLPKVIYLCEKHFEDDCFDKNQNSRCHGTDIRNGL